MRWTLTVLGSLTVIAYAVGGMLIANDWAVSAAAGVPLQQAIADMQAAGQPYSPVPGYIFAGLGVALTIGWAILALRTPSERAWLPIALWALILSVGAVAYFFAAFGNLMSVGDTYEAWDQGAALRVEAVLYLVSALAGLVLFTVVTIVIIRWIVLRRFGPQES